MPVVGSRLDLGDAFVWSRGRRLASFALGMRCCSVGGACKVLRIERLLTVSLGVSSPCDNSPTSISRLRLRSSAGPPITMRPAKCAKSEDLDKEKTVEMATNLMFCDIYDPVNWVSAHFTVFNVVVLSEPCIGYFLGHTPQPSSATVRSAIGDV